MPSSARLGLSSPSQHSSSAASIICMYTLIKSHDYAMLPPSAAFPSEFSHSDCADLSHQSCSADFQASCSSSFSYSVPSMCGKPFYSS